MRDFFHVYVYFSILAKTRNEQTVYFFEGTTSAQVEASFKRGPSRLESIYFCARVHM